MQTAGDALNIVLFVSVIGGAFTLLSLLISRLCHFIPPLWFGNCQMAAFVIPVLAPGLHLIPPEFHSWRLGYYAACAVWLGGIIILTVCDAIKAAFAQRAVRRYAVCRDSRICAVCSRCAKILGMEKVPSVRFGTLDDPACVLGVRRPAIILNEEAAGQLTDAELLSVISHEMMHSRRGHLLLARLYDYICILHWFNPLVWIAKKDFVALCESDCDCQVLTALQEETTPGKYAGTIVRLLELSVSRNAHRRHGMGALGCLSAKRRIATILSRPAAARRIWTAGALGVLLAAMILFSATLSRGYFYPFPAYSMGPECSPAGSGALLCSIERHV